MLTSFLRHQRIMSFHKALSHYQLFSLFIMFQLHLTMFQLHSYPLRPIIDAKRYNSMLIMCILQIIWKTDSSEKENLQY